MYIGSECAGSLLLTINHFYPAFLFKDSEVCIFQMMCIYIYLKSTVPQNKFQLSNDKTFCFSNENAEHFFFFQREVQKKETSPE